MFRPPSLDIVIVNYNGGSYLHECLRSVSATRRSHFSLGTVALVDNASSDGSVDAVQQGQLPLVVIRNRQNRGFAAACNQGATIGRSDLILFLNPDVRLFVETLERTVRFMADPGHQGIGICGGQMVGDHGVPQLSCSRFPTLLMAVTKMTGLAHAFPRWVPRQRLTATDIPDSGFVDQVIGAYFMTRRQLFEDLDGFDERFFVYMEEVDLALRASRRGYPSYFLADVPVYHKEGVSSVQVGGRRLFYLLRSQTEYARKHWPRWQAPLLALLFLVLELPVRAALAVIQPDGNVSDVLEAARLYLGYVRGRPSGGPATR